MQNEIDGELWAVHAQILGINEVGQEAGNAGACAGKDLPWLQETADHLAWSVWDVTYRDVIILDSSNRKVATYNLTEHDLSNPANYLELKGLLHAAAGAR